MKEPKKDHRKPTKEHLKREFGLWAIRREDVTAALHTWMAFRKAGDASDLLSQLVAFSAFVANYGRIFTGDLGLPSKSPWVTADDADLHAQLMSLRNEAVAHSDWAFRAVRLIPPGAEPPGIPPVPAHEIGQWRWFVRVGELKVDVDHVERRLRDLQRRFETEVNEAFDRLIQHCSDQIVAASETPLSEF